MGTNTACVQTEYFSGQGAFLLATRSGVGVPLGFRPIGNVSALTLGIEVEDVEHKESCTGSRATDLKLVTEVSMNITFTAESIFKENLALFLFGSSSSIVGAGVVDEPVVAHHDLWSPLVNIKVSSVVVTGTAGTPVYVEDTDFICDNNAGAILALSTGSISDLEVLEVDYTFATQDNVETLLSSSTPERWARFHGLNTARNPSEPVVVDIFRLGMEPLAELALINNDNISQLEIESEALADTFQTGGTSQFARIRKIPL